MRPTQIIMGLGVAVVAFGFMLLQVDMYASYSFGFVGGLVITLGYILDRDAVSETSRED